MLTEEEYKEEEAARYREFLRDEADIQAWVEINTLLRAGKASPINAQAVFTAPGDAARGPPGRLSQKQRKSVT